MFPKESTWHDALSKPSDPLIREILHGKPTYSITKSPLRNYVLWRLLGILYVGITWSTAPPFYFQHKVAAFCLHTALFIVTALAAHRSHHPSFQYPLFSSPSFPILLQFVPRPPTSVQLPPPAISLTPPYSDWISLTKKILKKKHSFIKVFRGSCH